MNLKADIVYGISVAVFFYEMLNFYHISSAFGLVLLIFVSGNPVLFDSEFQLALPAGLLRFDNYIYSAAGFHSIIFMPSGTSKTETSL